MTSWAYLPLVSEPRNAVTSGASRVSAPWVTRRAVAGIASDLIHYSRSFGGTNSQSTNFPAGDLLLDINAILFNVWNDLKLSNSKICTIDLFSFQCSTIRWCWQRYFIWHYLCIRHLSQYLFEMKLLYITIIINLS